MCDCRNVGVWHQPPSEIHSFRKSAHQATSAFFTSSTSLKHCFQFFHTPKTKSSIFLLIFHTASVCITNTATAYKSPSFLPVLLSGRKSKFLLTHSSHYFGYRLSSFASRIQKKNGIWIRRMRMHLLQLTVYTLSQGATETEACRLFSAQINVTG